MTGYANIPKPTGASYSNVNPVGKQTYDDANTTYDSLNSFYDGIESGVYINISKPIGSAYTNIAKPT